MAAAKPFGWNGVVIALHWLGAALILGLLAQGLAMVHGRFGTATAFDLYQEHKSFGLAALAVTAARLAARFRSTAPRALASRLWERRLAAAVQALLYALTLAAILSGWFVVSASPLPIPTRFFGLFVVPNLGGPNPALFAGAALAHRLIAWAIVFLVTLHASGALKHHFIDQDDTLVRMLGRRETFDNRS